MTFRVASSLVVDGFEPPSIAVVGTGPSGAACAAGLLRAGFDVTAFDKSREVGGRMATRRVEWAGDDGVAHTAAFDHGCAGFTVTQPRFRAAVDGVAARGGAVRWRPVVHAAFPSAGRQEVVVPTPDMPAFCRHLLHGVPLRLGNAVTALERVPGGWMLALADGHREGPFDRVVVALPPAQAATLLNGHGDGWDGALADAGLWPCWTLMAVTDDVDWPWDAARIERGELAWIARNDHVPGRSPIAGVPWVAHATPEWSLAHLEDDPVAVREALCAALGRLLTGGAGPRWHHAGVHRWRHARRVEPGSAGAGARYCNATGLGVCGDAFGDGSVEGAWCSGDDLARVLVESLAPRPAGVASLRSRAAPSGRNRIIPQSPTFPPLPTGDTRWAPPDAPF